MPFLTPSIIKLSYGGSAVEFNPGSQTSGTQLTLSDHSRSELSIDYDVIEKSQRMANGTLRKYVVAKKKSFSCSWDSLPTVTSFVVDGYADAKKMKQYYELYSGQPLMMILYYGRNEPAILTDNEVPTTTSYAEIYNVFWESFSFEVVKRYQNFDYWNVDAEFVEI